MVEFYDSDYKRNKTFFKVTFNLQIKQNTTSLESMMNGWDS